MRRISVIPFGLLAGLLAWLPAWGQLPSKEVLDRRARELGTDSRSSQQAHELLRGGTVGDFSFPTVVFGLEKAQRDRIRKQVGLGEFRSPEERAILEALEPPAFCSSGAGGPRLSRQEARQCELIGQQRESLESYLDEGKRTFVSHIAFWPGREETEPIFLHNVYVDCRQGTLPTSRGSTPEFSCEETVYDNSWRALEKLQSFLSQLVDQQEFTHILLISKGWNTQQGKSVEAYRELPQLIGLEASKENRRFHPLVVGITWHSGWVWGVSEIPILKVVPNVASYGNKAKDADEIGVTWANALLNRVLLTVAGRKDLPVMAIGHSFGARILSRASASAGLLGTSSAGAKPAAGAGTESEIRVSLLVSLQGAFSMNRFLPERCSGTEGAPYGDLVDKVDRVVLVWSENDRTNPLAQMVSQANHVGGSPGHRRARSYAHRFRFRRWRPGWAEAAGAEISRSGASWSGAKRQGKQCASFDPPAKPVEVVDATSIVKNHGDVVDGEMAALLWALIREGRS
ncbi:MAG: hypothetical protein K0U98_00305 [Deltaproteobacteria bacterium]|nr:hypothetical protein [Deltaproteobacteria bacterium]